MEHRARFELAVLGICSPLHWASLPPVHMLATPDGFEPPQAVLETAVLPLTPRGNDWCDWADSNRHDFRRQILSLLWLPLHHSRELLTKHQIFEFGKLEIIVFHK